MKKVMTLTLLLIVAIICYGQDVIKIPREYKKSLKYDINTNIAIINNINVIDYIAYIAYKYPETEGLNLNLYKDLRKVNWNNLTQLENLNMLRFHHNQIVYDTNFYQLIQKMVNVTNIEMVIREDTSGIDFSYFDNIEILDLSVYTDNFDFKNSHFDSLENLTKLRLIAPIWPIYAIKNMETLKTFGTTYPKKIGPSFRISSLPKNIHELILDNWDGLLYYKISLPPSIETLTIELDKSIKNYAALSIALQAWILAFMNHEEIKQFNLYNLNEAYITDMFGFKKALQEEISILNPAVKLMIRTIKGIYY